MKIKVQIEVAAMRTLTTNALLRYGRYSRPVSKRYAHRGGDHFQCRLLVRLSVL